MTERMTHGEFARHAANIARRATGWAADTLILPEDYAEPMLPISIERFVGEIREHLNIIERATRPVCDATGEG